MSPEGALGGRTRLCALYIATEIAALLVAAEMADTASE
jgi:hypothetical protein